VLLAKPHCRNSLQRSQAGALATPASGSRGPAPGTLRSLLSQYCSNSRRMVQPFSSLPPFCAGDIIELAFASVRLCESEPRMMSVMKSGGACYSFKILAKIAASQGWQHPVEVPSSSPSTPFAPSGVDWQNRDRWQDLFVRASAQFFPQICIRAEARRGFFPLLFLQHQTGPP
jgi:hypothetical protein